MSKSILRSELADVAKRKRQLAKIRELHAEDPRHVVFQMDGDRFSAALADDVLIDETAVSDNIQFRRPPNASAAAKAFLAVQDLLYTADAAGAAGNSISIEYQDLIPAVAASKVIQDLTYTAVTAGAAGNSITVEYVDDGTAGAETVNVAVSAITVHMEAGVSTAQNIKDAVDGTPAAAALVSVDVSGTAGAFQAAQGATNLENGADTIGTAGSEDVAVTGTDILVTMEAGVSTAAQIKAAIEASVPAAALVDVSILGSGPAAQDVYAQTSLAQGADQSALESYDLADIESIKRLRTKKFKIKIKSGSNPA